MIRKVVMPIIAAVFLSSLIGQVSFAANTSNFQAGDIIDDSVFTNANTMSVTDIQNFLNSKVPTCDTNHTGTVGGTGTAYNPPFICLKDFYENPSATYTVSFSYLDSNCTAQAGSRTYYYNNAYQYTSLTPVYNNGDCHQGYVLKATIQTMNGVRPSGSISAAQIIYNLAQQYQINPQVLIVLLQKEQGLVTDTWPEPWEYQSATGYGCPDYSPCNAGYSGFSNQLTQSATMFRAIMNNSPTWYTPYVLGNNFIQYSPISSCGGSNVYVQNRATQALYNYTPYQPDAAALAAGYGNGDSCSSYGNRNFWLYFTDWFGPTTDIYRYSFETLAGPSGSVIPENVNTDTTQTVTIGGSMYVFYNNKTTGTLEYAVYSNNTWSHYIIDGPSSTAIGSTPSAVSVGSMTAFEYQGSPQLFYTNTATGTVRHAFMSSNGFHIETLDGTTSSVLPSSRALGSAISGFNFGNGQIQLYYYNTSNNSLVHTWWNNGHWNTETLDGLTTAVFGNNINSGERINTQLINGSIFVLYYDDATGVTSGRTSAWRIAYTNGSWIDTVLDGGSTSSKSGSAASIPISAISSTQYNGSPQIFYADSNNYLRHAWLIQQ